MSTRALIAAFLAALSAFLHAASAAPSEHVMLGPYEYEESGEKVPRFYLIDDTRCESLSQLKQAAANLSPGSRLVWRRSDASPPSVIRFGLLPTTISSFRNFCAIHHVDFTAIVQR